MNAKTLIKVYEERKRTYHMVNAISNVAKTEPAISEKLKQLIAETQREVTDLYLSISHDIHEECSNIKKGEIE